MTRNAKIIRRQASSPRVYLLVLAVVAALAVIGIITSSVREVSSATSSTPGLRASEEVEYLEALLQRGAGAKAVATNMKIASDEDKAGAVKSTTTPAPIDVNTAQVRLDLNNLQKENDALREDVKVWRKRTELYSEYATSLWAGGKATPSALNVLINAKLKEPTWGSVDMVRFFVARTVERAYVGESPAGLVAS